MNRLWNTWSTCLKQLLGKPSLKKEALAHLEALLYAADFGVETSERLLKATHASTPHPKPRNLQTDPSNHPGRLRRTPQHFTDTKTPRHSPPRSQRQRQNHHSGQTRLPLPQSRQTSPTRLLRHLPRGSQRATTSLVRTTHTHTHTQPSPCRRRRGSL